MLTANSIFFRQILFVVFFCVFSYAGIDTKSLYKKGLHYFLDEDDGQLKKVNADGSCCVVSGAEVPYWKPGEKNLIFVVEQGFHPNRINAIKKQKIKPRHGYPSYKYKPRKNVPDDFGKCLVSGVILSSMYKKRGLWFYVCVIDNYGTPKRIVFWFPEWPGLKEVSSDHFTQGVILFPAYLDQIAETQKIDFNGQTFFRATGKKFILTPFESIKKDGVLVNGNTFVALECFANFDGKILRFWNNPHKSLLSIDFSAYYTSFSKEISIVTGESCLRDSFFGENCSLHTFNVNIIKK